MKFLNCLIVVTFFSVLTISCGNKPSNEIVINSASYSFKKKGFSGRDEQYKKYGIKESSSLQNFPIQFDNIEIVKKSELLNDGHNQLVKLHFVGSAIVCQWQSKDFGYSKVIDTVKFDETIEYLFFKNSYGEWSIY